MNEDANQANWGSNPPRDDSGYAFELLRSRGEGFHVTQTLSAYGVGGPQDAAKRLDAPIDGEVVLVRFVAGGGVTAFKVSASPTFTLVPSGGLA